MELSLFGSRLRDDFTSESDVDILIAFGPAPRHGLLGFVRIQRELEEVFGRQVDLISRRAVEQSRNPFRRKAILESARVVYERV